MVSQPLKEIPDIALRFRYDKIGWFRALDGMLKISVIRSWLPLKLQYASRLLYVRSSPPSCRL